MLNSREPSLRNAYRAEKQGDSLLASHVFSNCIRVWPPMFLDKLATILDQTRSLRKENGSQVSLAVVVVGHNQGCGALAFSKLAFPVNTASHDGLVWHYLGRPLVEIHSMLVDKNKYNGVTSWFPWAYTGYNRKWKLGLSNLWLTLIPV